MKTWNESAPHDMVENIAEMLEDYACHHTYTEWETDHLASLVDILRKTAVVTESQIKQRMRTAGGLTRKVAAQGQEIRKLEARLAELESDDCGFCDGSKKWPEHESKLGSIVR